MSNEEEAPVKSLGILAGIAVLIAIYVQYGRVIRAITSSGAKAPNCVEMVGNTTSEDGGVTTIIGTVRNNCERKYGYVQVVFKLERGGNSDLPEGIVTASGRDLKPGDTWEFKTFPVPRNVSYRLDEINAY